ncbi:hypothetical protein DIPPA_09139 [Diplonema papillatum]|nr:hypothetical protein DIPPA_27433 [Diplonema papillatum]KAJ9459659.1 hypothetical protein DIPPA_16843 [Diplonema papillatum]KAJ9466324.1 hypothetical protein DIPPA_09139 [Diplonema papillatum]
MPTCALQPACGLAKSKAQTVLSEGAGAPGSSGRSWDRRAGNLIATESEGREDGANASEEAAIGLRRSRYQKAQRTHQSASEEVERADDPTEGHAVIALAP